MFKKVKRYLADPYWALGCDLIKKHPNWMSDEFYIRTLWRMVMGYKLDLKNPKTFNEKLQWLKLYDHNPLYTTLVDKLRVKDWVAEKIGAQYVIPTLAVWEKAEDIDISNLPNQFVLKCNHDSGSVVICKDKNTFDLDTAKEKLGKALQHNFYWDAREWAYKNVKPCVFAEVYMEDNVFGELQDYEIFTFSREPKIIQVDFDRFKVHKRNLYDIAWNYIEARIQFPNDPSKTIEKSKALQELLDLSKKISKGIAHVRTDFYLINEKIYFGEMTFYHGAGHEKFLPSELEQYFSDFIQLDDNQHFSDGVIIFADGFVLFLHAEFRNVFCGLRDYKFFCFNGKPELMYIANDKSEYATTDFFDMDFNYLDIHMKDPHALVIPEKPRHFEEMKRIAAILSENIPAVRIDFYETSDCLYFGEYTFYHSAGYAKVHPKEWNNRLGDMIKLPI